MRWSKIKNIIILLLVVVNGFLLGQVGLREWQSRRDERETRERMVDILARNQVSYLPDEVPGALEMLDRRVTLAPLGEAEAALLVGTVSDVQTVGGRTVYTGAEGTVASSTTGELTVEFLPGSTLTESTLQERLSKLGVTLREVDRTGEAEDPTISYVQLWSGAPVPGERAILEYEAQCPRTLTIRLLFGAEEVLPTEETITAVTALARLLDELNRGEGYVCSQITDMYPGYISGGTRTVTLTPAWCIETDTWRFIVDGHTGGVTAME